MVKIPNLNYLEVADAIMGKPQNICFTRDGKSKDLAYERPFTNIRCKNTGYSKVNYLNVKTCVKMLHHNLVKKKNYISTYALICFLQYLHFIEVCQPCALIFFFNISTLESLVDGIKDSDFVWDHGFCFPLYSHNSQVSNGSP